MNYKKLYQYVKSLRSEFNSYVSSNRAMEESIEGKLNKLEKLIGVDPNPQPYVPKAGNGKDYAHKHNGYTHEDIFHLLKQGYLPKAIKKLIPKAKLQEISAIKAHITMGTYNNKRELSDKEKEKIRNDLSKGKTTEDIARKYDVARIQIMGIKAGMNRGKNVQ
ncbi:MAG: hypothetical protein KKE23_02255 [Nanoarchaeota archaeon]|nr:hypothetical protein [Nanoarchaeota archaeon]